MWSFLIHPRVLVQRTLQSAKESSAKFLCSLCSSSLVSFVTSDEMVLSPKTETMHFPIPGLRYEDADTDPLLVNGGEVPLTVKYKLLGCLLAYNLVDECEKDDKGPRSLFKLSLNHFSVLKD
jgi:hypothetical protein